MPNRDNGRNTPGVGGVGRGGGGGGHLGLNGYPLPNSCAEWMVNDKK